MQSLDPCLTNKKYNRSTGSIMSVSVFHQLVKNSIAENKFSIHMGIKRVDSAAKVLPILQPSNYPI